MSTIQIRNLSFTYPASYAPVFSGLNFTMDSSWRLGLVGRNGRGKTTLIRLLARELIGTGEIISSVKFDRFPFACDEEKSARCVMRAAIAPYDMWELRMNALLAAEDEVSLAEWGEIEAEYAAHDGYQIDELIAREAGKLGITESNLERPFSSFSPGEQTRMQLAALFLKKNHFLLIDEPTNHLDMRGRQLVADYLRGKQGFLLVSHDRWFLDQTVDHICALEKTGVHVEKGNYSSYRENKRLRDEFEIEKNERLAEDIRRLHETAREKATWSERVESTKIGEHTYDRGRVGHLAAKAMKRSISIQTRIERQIEEKEALLKDLEYASPLSLHPLVSNARHLMRLNNVAAGYGDKKVISGLTMDVMRGDKIAIVGPNGAGKSTLLKLLMGQIQPMEGRFTRAGGLTISYMPQRAEALRDTPVEYAGQQGLQLDFFLMLLRKLDFPREAFERGMEDYSMGQRKKVLLAASMAKHAHLYIWDEPLNYMDLESREQIENMLAESDATMIFIEHDRRFVEKCAARTVTLNKG